MQKYAIILVRVSTYKQDYDAQILDLENYAKSKGFNRFKVIETKETGLADLSDKVGTNQMFAFVNQNPNYKTVFATEISRIGRRQSVLHQIKEWFIQNRVQLHIKDTGYSLFDDSGVVSVAGEMMFSLYGLFAESEIKQRLERFVRKRKELMEKGLSISGKTLFGYKRQVLENEKTTLVLDKENADIVRKIFNWYLKGIDSTTKNPSIKRITLECIKKGFPSYTHSKRNVNKLLKEEGYTGYKTTNNKRKNPKFSKSSLEPEYLISGNIIRYPVIVDRALFDSVQSKLRDNIVNGDKETKHVTLLAKLINCPACGRKMSANYRITTDGAKNSYRCTSRTDATPCKSKKSISMSLIDNAIWSVIKTDSKALGKQIEKLNPNLELVDLEAQRNNLLLREEEIQLEINAIGNNLRNFSNLKYIKTRAIEDSQMKRLEKLDREQGKIQQELARVETSRISIEKESSNTESILSINLDKIEGSKELLKKYINLFVKEIDITQHGVKYTVLRITLKYYTQNQYISRIQKKQDKNFYQYCYIIIDKRVTRQIKLIREKAHQKEQESKLFEPSMRKVIPRIMNDLDKGKVAALKFIPYTKLYI